MSVCELCGQPLVHADEHPFADLPPGDATIWVRQQPDEPARSDPPPRGTRGATGGSGSGPRWYLSPWPYLGGILLIVAVVASLLVARSSAEAYPELVVNSKPTLLDFYTDT